MRQRSRLQNLPKYTDRLKLDQDLLVLQRALQNKIASWRPEEGHWQLPMIIANEQHRHSNVVAPLPPQLPAFLSPPYNTLKQFSNQYQDNLPQPSGSKLYPYQYIETSIYLG